MRQTKYVPIFLSQCCDPDPRKSTLFDVDQRAISRSFFHACQAFDLIILNQILLSQIDVTVNAPTAGKITALLANEEDTVTVGQDLFKIEPGAEGEGNLVLCNSVYRIDGVPPEASDKPAEKPTEEPKAQEVKKETKDEGEPSDQQVDKKLPTPPPPKVYQQIVLSGTSSNHLSRRRVRRNPLNPHPNRHLRNRKRRRNPRAKGKSQKNRKNSLELQAVAARQG